MKSAIVHDWLVGVGGAERVVEALLELFPSPLYTLVYDPRSFEQSPISRAEVYTSFLQKLPYAPKIFRSALALFPAAIERLDLKQYPLILSSSHAVAKGVKKNPDQIHVCYCHTPMRYAWDLRETYLKTLRGPKQWLARPTLAYLRRWDQRTHSRVDYFVANSHYVRERIERIYGREAHVIYPPVNTHLFIPSAEREDYYFTCSRLVAYKRIDLLVEAFRLLPRKRLLIVGNGPEMAALRARASPNVQLLGALPDQEMRALLAKARAFLFAADEDFGITPVEAQAAGIPVIAYGKGGSLETVAENSSGLFFREQSVDSLIEALTHFENRSWDPIAIRTHAERFSKKRFLDAFSTFVSQITN